MTAVDDEELLYNNVKFRLLSIVKSSFEFNIVVTVVVMADTGLSSVVVQFMILLLLPLKYTAVGRYV